MERYEGGFRCSEKQEDAIQEASDMVTFVKDALQAVYDDGEVDPRKALDGALPIMKEIDKRLLYALLEDPEEARARILTA